MKTTPLLACACAMFLGAFHAPLRGQGLVQTVARVSEELPIYSLSVKVSGEISLEAVGTFADAALEWDRAFQKHHPNARLLSRARLSSEVIKLLTDGTTPMVLATREMTPDELSAFQARHGYTPIRIPVCLDPLIVIVNKGNPIEKISIEQLDAIFSTTRRSGTRLQGSAWGEMGLKGEWAKRPITPYVRAEGSAIHAMFAKIVLGEGTYKATVRSGADLNSLVESVVMDPGGISFVPLGMWFASVKVIPVVPLHGEAAYPPSQDAVANGKYPIVRAGYLFVNQTPGKPLAEPYREVVRFLLSREGQASVSLAGFLPAPAELLLSGARRIQ